MENMGVLWIYRIRVYGLRSPDVYMPMLDALAKSIENNWLVYFFAGEKKQIPLKDVDGKDLQQRVHELIDKYKLRRRFPKSVDKNRYAPAYKFVVQAPNDNHRTITRIETEYHQESGARRDPRNRHYEVVVISDRVMSNTLGELIKEERGELPEYAKGDRITFCLYDQS